MTHHRYRVGDWVVYHKTKYSDSPGPRAKEIGPAAHGDSYSYVVDKFWVVSDVDGDRVRLVTRRGKLHDVNAHDPNLRPAHWWEKLLQAARYRETSQVASTRPKLAAESEEAPVRPKQHVG